MKTERMPAKLAIEIFETVPVPQLRVENRLYIAAGIVCLWQDGHWMVPTNKIFKRTTNRQFTRCIHGLESCVQCKPCDHGRRSHCDRCYLCEHGHPRTKCHTCNAARRCSHNRYKQSCSICSRCVHGFSGYRCKRCQIYATPLMPRVLAPLASR